MKTEKQKYLEYIAEQVEKGLIDTKFFFTESAKNATEEELYAELNRMKDAPDVPYLELF